MIESIYYFSKSMISYLYRSPLVEELAAPVKVFIENYWFPPLVSTSLKEIAEKFKRQTPFYNYCEAHHIVFKFGDDYRINQYDIQLGDTVLLSAPAHRCSVVDKESLYPELQNHLALAESLIEYVQKKVPHSPNYLSRSLTFTRDGQNYISYTRSSIDEMEVWDPTNSFHVRTARAFVRKLKKWKLGVCQELALVGMIRAWRKHPDQRVELGFIYGGCHLFLVIGRENDSDPLDRRTWGEHCVICDPWAGKCYPLSALEEELFDYMGIMGDDDEGSSITYPYVRPFNPQTQAISICLKPFSKEEKLLILSGQADSVEVECFGVTKKEELKNYLSI